MNIWMKCHTCLKKKIVKTAKHLVLNTVLSLLKQSDFQAVRVVLN